MASHASSQRSASVIGADDGCEDAIYLWPRLPRGHESLRAAPWRVAATLPSTPPGHDRPAGDGAVSHPPPATYMINDFYRLLPTRGGKKGQPLAAETVRHVHRTFMKALKDLGVVIDGVRQPRRADRETPGRKGVWTAQECARFLAAVADDRLHAAWVLAIVCGMRRGELLGLKWPKVDVDNGVIYVHWRRTCANGMVKGGVIEKEPKGKSKRSIAIGPPIAAVLRRRLARQEQEMAAAGIAYHRLGHLFCNEDGKPYSPTFLTNRFRALCVQAEVPVIVLHDGRHSSATVGADHGVPQHAMQQRLGHANPRTTQEWYTHVLPEAERAAARIMEEAILGRVA